MFRQRLPQLEGGLFLTDGGMETTLIFHDGLELPCFASFVLLKTEAGRRAISEYFETYVKLALSTGNGLVLESPTWRASADWGEKLGYDAGDLATVNREAIDFMARIRNGFSDPACPIVISGNLGPRGDGYVVSECMSPEEARDYHYPQIETFSETDADVVSALTLTYAEEAIGITNAARALGMPMVISFTTETDGRLPNGQGLGEAIRQVDRATDNGPAYYMINCAHPDHFSGVLNHDESWTQRVRGIRANASRMSHAELDQAETLDVGDPVELGQLYRQLRERFPHINILGGCCGTDHRHIGQIGTYCKAA
jgi:S-methylmethionine-dependent homocysteine/selenocysteine methylase